MDCSPIWLATVLLVAGLLLPHKSVDCQNEVFADLLQALNDSTSTINREYYPTDDINESRCQPMKIPFCESIGYNQTMLPNFLKHETQQEVETELNVYDPLMKLGCSPDLKLFLCTVYAPICFDQMNGSKPLFLLPCRSLCESARQGCSNNMKNFNSEWPKVLQCDKFPDKKDKGALCVSKDDEPKFSTHGNDFNEKSIYGPSVTRDIGFVCPKNFEVASYTLRLSGKTYNNCAMPCEDVLLDKNSTHIVKLSTGILAAVCIISTVFTCMTFLLNKKRFKYPTRPIIIIAFCQLIVAVCYLIGCLTSNSISCNDPAEPPKSLPNMRMIRPVINGFKKDTCNILFMTLYFFQMSTMFWWLMMTISWYMIARLKWAPEAVSKVAGYFHGVSWTIPALLTCYLSVLGNIEGDSLSGTCYVSVSDQESIRLYVIYPTIICLVGGCGFLIVGFKSIWDSRENLKRDYGAQTDEHYKLVSRIGLFSMLFITFTLILLYCHHYERNNLDSWMLSWLSRICHDREYSIPCPLKKFSPYSPHYSVFMFKYAATMAIGIISALFMLSEKTLIAYREVAELCNYKI